MPASVLGSHTGRGGLGRPITGGTSDVVLSITSADVAQPPYVVSLEALVDSSVFLCSAFWVVAKGPDGEVLGSSLIGSGVDSLWPNIGIDCLFHGEIRLSRVDVPVRFFLYDDDWSIDELRRAGFPAGEAFTVSQPIEIVPTEQGREEGTYEEPTRQAGIGGVLDRAEGLIQTIAVTGAIGAAIWYGGPLLSDYLEQKTDDG